MGSPKPRAKAPQVVYYVPAPTPSPLPASAPGDNNTPAAQTPSANTPVEQEQSETVQRGREQNLLRRARGTLGTILTGFRGLLSQNDISAQRKSLLGE